MGLFFIVTAVSSIPLALFIEGFALQHGFLNGTPGLAIAGRLVPPSSERGFEAMRKQMAIELKVDAVLWFTLICGATALVTALRHRRRMRALEANELPRKERIEK